jgi:hypothetical protein
MQSNINLKIQNLIEQKFRFISPMQISEDAMRVSKEIGLNDLLFQKKYYSYNNHNFSPNLFLKDLTNYEQFKRNIKGVFIFGSLKGGNYVDNMEEFFSIKDKLKNKDQEFWYYTFISDMYNGGNGSDIDLCLIVDEAYYNKPNDEIKSELSNIFLNYPQYYFEHFSIIPKMGLYNLLESSIEIYNSNKKLDNKKFDLKFFNITSDYYPKGLEAELKKVHEKKREERKNRNIFYIEKLKELKDEFENNETKSKMIEYSLNRINMGITSEDNFGHQRVLRAVSNSFFVNFDPSFDVQRHNINDYSMISRKFKRFFTSFYCELKQEEWLKATRLNKIHPLKKDREAFFQEFLIKNKLNNNGE